MLSSICVFGAYHQDIEKKSFSSPVLLVLKCRWRVPLCTLTKNELLYAFRFTSGSYGRTLLARFTKKNNKTNGDHSRSRQRNRKSFRLTKTVHRLQRCHSRLQWSSFVVAAKVRRYVENSEKWTSWYNNNFVADNTLINRQLFSRNICLVSRKAQEEILSQVTKTKKYHCKIFVQ